MREGGAQLGVGGGYGLWEAEREGVGRMGDGARGGRKQLREEGALCMRVRIRLATPKPSIRHPPTACYAFRTAGAHRARGRLSRTCCFSSMAFLVCLLGW